VVLVDPAGMTTVGMFTLLPFVPKMVVGEVELSEIVVPPEGAADWLPAESSSVTVIGPTELYPEVHAPVIGAVVKTSCVAVAAPAGSASMAPKLVAIPVATTMVVAKNREKGRTRNPRMRNDTFPPPRFVRSSARLIVPPDRSTPRYSLSMMLETTSLLSAFDG
jgi:hypothetical protein